MDYTINLFETRLKNLKIHLQNPENQIDKIFISNVKGQIKAYEEILKEITKS